MKGFGQGFIFWTDFFYACIAKEGLKTKKKNDGENMKILDLFF